MDSDNESLLLLQAFMATIAALTLPVAALVWERKAVEAERLLLLEREQAARAEAEAANHAKDEFLAMLSHELRNPLAAISNAAQVLQAGEAKHVFAGRAVDIINRQARHLSRLIDDLLDVARVARGRIMLAAERLDWPTWCREVSPLCVAEAGWRSTGSSSIATPVWVGADPARLTQIVDNLLLNAIKYTPPDGLIEISTLSDGDEAALRVRDSGVGIPPELLPRIFDMFTQGPRSLDRAQGGLGVGLTLAHRLAQAHGGRIVAESAGPSRGCTFTVRLPRSRSAPMSLACAAQARDGAFPAAKDTDHRRRCRRPRSTADATDDRRPRRVRSSDRKRRYRNSGACQTGSRPAGHRLAGIRRLSGCAATESRRRLPAADRHHRVRSAAGSRTRHSCGH